MERALLKWNVQVMGETCQTQAEEDEKQAILASGHAEFYILLCRKLYCMISAFEVLSSGAVDHGPGETLQSKMLRLLHEKPCDALKGTNIGVFLANIVGHVKKNFAVVPFLDTVGSICQLILTLKDERDQYLSVARVADFATMIFITTKGDGLRCTVERFARIMVRARCEMPKQPFLETRNEFGKVKQFILRMLADAGNTPAKEQACKAANCCFAHIMTPTEGSELHSTFHGPCAIDQIAIDEVMAAATLETSVGEICKLGKFTRNAQLPTNKTPANNVTIAFISKSSASSSLEVPWNAHEHDANVPDELPENESKHLRQELDKLREELTVMKRRLSAAQPNHSMNAEGGLIYAVHRELYKDHMTAVIQQGREHHEQLVRLTSEIVVVMDRLEKLETREKSQENQPARQGSSAASKQSRSVELLTTGSIVVRNKLLVIRLKRSFCAALYLSTRSIEYACGWTFFL
jgi:hypothetical protein